MAGDTLGELVGRRLLLYLCIFPTAFFFFAAYNESLFLLFTASSFLAMRRQQWWLAGILGLFAALTRSAGIFLVIPYLYVICLSRDSFMDLGQSISRKLLDMLPSDVPVSLIP